MNYTVKDPDKALHKIVPISGRSRSGGIITPSGEHQWTDSYYPAYHHFAVGRLGYESSPEGLEKAIKDGHVRYVHTKNDISVHLNYHSREARTNAANFVDNLLGKGIYRTVYIDWMGHPKGNFHSDVFESPDLKSAVHYLRKSEDPLAVPSDPLRIHDWLRSRVLKRAGVAEQLIDLMIEHGHSYLDEVLKIPIVPMKRRFLGKVLSIDSASFSPMDQWSKKDYSGRLKNRRLDKLLVAKEPDKSAVGIVAGRMEHPTRLNIDSLAIDPSARGRGIGDSLLSAIEAHAKSKGASKVSLQVRKSNKTAQNLYAKRGYKIVSTMFKYYGDEDGYEMHKSL